MAIDLFPDTTYINPSSPASFCANPLLLHATRPPRRAPAIRRSTTPCTSSSGVPRTPHSPLFLPSCSLLLGAPFWHPRVPCPCPGRRVHHRRRSSASEHSSGEQSRATGATTATPASPTHTSTPPARPGNSSPRPNHRSYRNVNFGESTPWLGLPQPCSGDA